MTPETLNFGLTPVKHLSLEVLKQEYVPVNTPADSRGWTWILVTAGLVITRPGGGVTQVLLNYSSCLFHTVNNLPLNTWNSRENQQYISMLHVVKTETSQIISLGKKP